MKYKYLKKKDSNKEGTGPLRRTYVLSPRQLKRTSGVSCCASVLEFQQTPVIKKSVPVTPELCNPSLERRNCNHNRPNNLKY